MTLNLLILFESFWIGFFYTFLSTDSLQKLISYFNYQAHLKGLITVTALTLMQTIWAVVAFFVLSLLISFISPSFDIIALLGCLFLFVIALKIYREQSIYKQYQPKPSLSSTFVSAFLLAAKRPKFFVAYISTFAALGLNYHSLHLSLSLLLILALFMGTLIFYLLLIVIISQIKKWSPSKLIHYFHKLSIFVLFIAASIGLLRIYL